MILRNWHASRRMDIAIRTRTDVVMQGQVRLPAEEWFRQRNFVGCN